jgi:hypothetical protein
VNKIQSSEALHGIWHLCACPVLEKIKQAYSVKDQNLIKQQDSSRSGKKFDGD